MSDQLTGYIDGFVFPVPRIYLSEYKNVAEKIAEIWREYGALAYYEYVGEDLHLEGTRSFTEVVDVKDDEAIVFGWVVFPSKQVRDVANEQVPNDSRISELIAPLTRPARLIFDASRMVYGGFQPLLQSSDNR